MSLFLLPLQLTAINASIRIIKSLNILGITITEI